MAKKNWFENLAKESELRSSGIYEWLIDGKFVYIGKGTVIRDRMSAYPRQAESLRAGKAYRRQKPNGYRAIHRKLAEALERNWTVVFRVREVCDVEWLNEREQAWITYYRKQESTGAIEVLNETMRQQELHRRDSHAQNADTIKLNRSATVVSASNISPRENPALGESWYRCDANDKQLSQPGIYRWMIEEETIYVGLTEQLGVRLDYMVRKTDQLYRNASGGQLNFRDIYRQLSEARRCGAHVAFEILEVCDAEILTERKGHWKKTLNLR